jgi:hypothetical protein
MKAIISHDIDHITVWEHFTRDLIIPKFIVRSEVELLTGKISFTEFYNRLTDLLRNKWQNLDELVSFNQSVGVPSSFFIGVANGLGLSYPPEVAAYWTKKLIDNGCEVGVHGIAFETPALIKKEYEYFLEISSLDTFGTRTHYVRKNAQTFQFMAETGYLYDSSEHAFKDPYKVGNMWEFPIQIMDGWVIEYGRRWQTRNLSQSVDATKRLIDQAHEKSLSYLGLDFHDRYFSKSFKTWMAWYTWLTGYLHECGINFCDFHSAVGEMSKLSNKGESGILDTAP